ncbi:hypothetical protein LINPERPRIM_LOCUS22250, partial [Linum perenne]
VASRFAAAGANLRSSATCNRGGASKDIGRLSGNTRRQLRTASFDLPCSSSEEIERERTGARRHLLRSISQVGREESCLRSAGSLCSSYFNSLTKRNLRILCTSKQAIHLLASICVNYNLDFQVSLLVATACYGHIV